MDKIIGCFLAAGVFVGSWVTVKYMLAEHGALPAMIVTVLVFALAIYAANRLGGK